MRREKTLDTGGMEREGGRWEGMQGMAKHARQAGKATGRGPE